MKMTSCKNAKLRTKNSSICEYHTPFIVNQACNRTVRILISVCSERGQSLSINEIG